MGMLKHLSHVKLNLLACFAAWLCAWVPVAAFPENPLCIPIFSAISSYNSTGMGLIWPTASAQAQCECLPTVLTNHTLPVLGVRAAVSYCTSLGFPLAKPTIELSGRLTLFGHCSGIAVYQELYNAVQAAPACEPYRGLFTPTAYTAVVQSTLCSSPCRPVLDGVFRSLRARAGVMCGHEVADTLFAEAMCHIVPGNPMCRITQGAAVHVAATMMVGVLGPGMLYGEFGAAGLSLSDENKQFGLALLSSQGLDTMCVAPCRDYFADQIAWWRQHVSSQLKLLVDSFADAEQFLCASNPLTSQYCAELNALVNGRSLRRGVVPRQLADMPEPSILSHSWPAWSLAQAMIARPSPSPLPPSSPAAQRQPSPATLKEDPAPRHLQTCRKKFSPNAILDEALRFMISFNAGTSMPTRCIPCGRQYAQLLRRMYNRLYQALPAYARSSNAVLVEARARARAAHFWTWRSQSDVTASLDVAVAVNGSQLVYSGSQGHLVGDGLVAEEAHEDAYDAAMYGILNMTLGVFRMASVSAIVQHEDCADSGEEAATPCAALLANVLAARITRELQFWQQPMGGTPAERASMLEQALSPANVLDFLSKFTQRTRQLGKCDNYWVPGTSAMVPNSCSLECGLSAAAVAPTTHGCCAEFSLRGVLVMTQQLLNRQQEYIDALPDLFVNSSDVLSWVTSTGSGALKQVVQLAPEEMVLTFARHGCTEYLKSTELGWRKCPLSVVSAQVAVSEQVGLRAREDQAALRNLTADVASWLGMQPVTAELEFTSDTLAKLELEVHSPSQAEVITAFIDAASTLYRVEAATPALAATWSHSNATGPIFLPRSYYTASEQAQRPLHQRPYYAGLLPPGAPPGSKQQPTFAVAVMVLAFFGGTVLLGVSVLYIVASFRKSRRATAPTRDSSSFMFDDASKSTGVDRSGDSAGADVSALYTDDSWVDSRGEHAGSTAVPAGMLDSNELPTQQQPPLYSANSEEEPSALHALAMHSMD